MEFKEINLLMDICDILLFFFVKKKGSGKLKSS